VFYPPALGFSRPFDFVSFLNSSPDSPKTLRVGLFLQNTAELGLVWLLGFESPSENEKTENPAQKGELPR